MISGQKNLISEQHLSWTKSWGFSLAYAITRSSEKAEKLVAETMVALITSNVAISVKAIRLATMLWELGQRDAYHGLSGVGDEFFFKMPTITRAIATLKVHAKFSQAQIATALHLNVKEVESHLENARLKFSSGKPWIETSINTSADASCQKITRVGFYKYELQDAFAQYVENDLDFERNQYFYSHLLNCNHCRNLFTKFKIKYMNWVRSIPMIHPNLEQRRYLSHITQAALCINRQIPSLLPGIRSVLEKPKNLIYFLGFFILGISIYFYKT